MWSQLIKQKIDGSDIEECCKILELNMYPYKVEYNKYTQHISIYHIFDKKDEDYYIYKTDNKDIICEGDRNTIKKFLISQTLIKSVDCIDRIFPNIEMFLGSENLIEFPRCLLNLNYLKDIYLDGAQFTTLPKDLYKAVSLENLYITCTKIRQIPCYYKETDRYTFAGLGQSEFKYYVSMHYYKPSRNNNLETFYLGDINSYVRHIGRSINVRYSSTFNNRFTFHDERHKIYVENTLRIK